jgi:hypothetical protein
MQRLIRISSISKDFFDLLDRAKRQKKAVSISKLIIVSIICFVVIWLYATRVNQASTRGYFLKQETKKYNELVFHRSISQLDVLQSERTVYDRVFKSRKSWYDKNIVRKVVEIWKPQWTVVPVERIDQIILPVSLDTEQGVTTIFEPEP